MNTHIVVIPHSTHRYETVGDYWMKAGNNLEIRVSDCLPVAVEDYEGSVDSAKTREFVRLADRYEFLIALHEFIEAFLCRDAGVSYHDIDEFDMNFEGEGEPGDHESCPYKVQHAIATAVEKEMAERLGVDWDKYGADLLKLAPQQQETSST